MIHKLLENIGNRRNDVIELHRNLTAIPALGPDNGGSGEKEKSEYILKKLEELGINDITHINAPDDRVECGFRPNIAALLPGEDTERTFWIISHMDVVPAGDLGLWNSDPFELVVEDDVIIGRGVEDNQQGIVASTVLLAALKDLNITPPVNLGLLFVADEENGSKYGLDYVVRERPDLFKKTDLILVPDFGTPDSTMVETAEKSMFWLKIMVYGKQCHASTPDAGINSLTASAAFILKINDLKKKYSARNELFDPPYSTFEPTKKEANVPNVNTIPGYDVFYVDSRVLPDYDMDEIHETIKAMGKEVEAEYSVRIEYETVIGDKAADPTPPDSEIVARIIRGVKAVYNTDAKPVGIGGGTVAAFLRRHGLPAAVWCTCLHNAHQPNEKTFISTQINDAKVMARVLMDDYE